MADKRIAGTGSVVKRRNGTYQAQIWVDGKRVYRYGKTPKEAQAKLDEVRLAASRGLPSTPQRLTFGQFLDMWLTDCIQPPHREPSTYVRYLHDVRNHIVPKLGRVRLAKLTQHQLDALLAEKLEGRLSPRSVQMIRGTMRTALEQAMRWDLVHRNVAKLTMKISVRRPKVQPFSLDEAKVFIAATEADQHMALYRVVLALGLRRGEALALRWYDPRQPDFGGVDLEVPIVYVRQALQRIKGVGLRVKQLKTDKSQRNLPLPEIAVEALRIHRDRQVFERQQSSQLWPGLVFTSNTGTPLDPDNVTHGFQRFLKRVGLPHQRFHDLRHACASLMAADGVPLLVIQAQLGHSQYFLTADTYSHLYDQTMRDAAGRMNAMLRSAK